MAKHNVMLSEDFTLKPGGAWRLGVSKPVGDLSQGGQNGISPDLRYYVANSSYVSRPMNAVLIAAPRVFSLMPDPEFWIGTLKALVETWAEEWEGVQSTMRVEYVETNVGASETQSDVARVYREKSEPTMKVSEKYGMSINRFMEGWISYGMGSPESFVPGIIAYLTNANGTAKDKRDKFQYLPDWLSMTVLFYEPTPEGTDVQKAWLCTNMMPDHGGEVTGRRSLQSAGEKLEHSFKFTCTQQVGDGVLLFAKKVHNTVNLSGLNPSLRKAFVDDGKLNTGIATAAAEAAYAAASTKGNSMAHAFDIKKQATEVRNGTKEEQQAGYRAQSFEVANDRIQIVSSTSR